MITGYSLEDPAEESYFLQNELGISWEKKSPNDLIDIISQNLDYHKRTLVICSRPQLYETIFRKSLASSIVVFLLSDEAYEPASRKLMKSSESIAVIFRNYAISLASASDIAFEIGIFFRNFINSKESPLDFLKCFLLGFRSTFRMWRWRCIRKPVVVVPLGYTNKFAKSYSDVRLSVDNELREKPFFDYPIPKESMDKGCAISFRGVKGQIQRRMALSTLYDFHDFDLVLVQDIWAGSSSSKSDAPSYVSSLLNSERALCPPGFVNLESFRYYEALLCHSLPIENRVAISHLGTAPARPQHGKSVDLEGRLILIRDTLLRVKLDLEKSLFIGKQHGTLN